MGAQPVPLLSNPDADRVKKVRQLAGRSARRKQGAFLVEGPGPVAAALQAGAVREVYLTEEFAHAEAAAPGNTLIDAVAQHPKVFGAQPDVFRAMSDTQTPQGILAVAQWRSAELDNVLSGNGVVLGIVGVQDPGNVGTMIRTADALGATGVVVTTGSADVLGPKCVRSTAGSIFGIPVAWGISDLDLVGQAKSSGRLSLAASGYAPTRLGQLYASGASGPLGTSHMWLLGNEAQGLRSDVMAAADMSVAIELEGTAESLNVAMAAAVLLQTSRLAHQLAGNDTKVSH